MFSRFRKAALRVFIGFLSVTALLAIISVLSGEFGEFELKVLGTTAAISAASICSMSGAAFIERGMRIELGLVGIAMSILGAILVIVGMWPEFESEGYWKTTFTMIICAVGLAHAFLLALPRFDNPFKYIQIASWVFIAVLSIQLMVAMWAEIDEEGYYRVLAVTAILVGLCTLLVPILMKLRKGEGTEKVVLQLEGVGNDTYRDPQGKLYKVTRIHEGSKPEVEEIRQSQSHPDAS